MKKTKDTTYLFSTRKNHKDVINYRAIVSIRAPSAIIKLIKNASSSVYYWAHQIDCDKKKSIIKFINQIFN